MIFLKKRHGFPVTALQHSRAGLGNDIQRSAFLDQITFESVALQLHPLEKMDVNRRILVVDDDRLICCGLERLFSGRSFQVTTVGNGKDAISELSQNPYETVFLDVHLPDMNGLQILHEIKSRAPHTRVFVMTADEESSWKDRALNEGATDFIKKPFNIPEVENLIENISSTKSAAV